MSRYQKLFLLIIALVIGASAAVYFKPMRKGLDLAGGVRVVLQAKPGSLVDDKGKPLSDQARAQKMAAVMKTLRKRVDAIGAVDPVLQLQGTDRVIIELPGIRNIDEALRMIQRTDRLEFYWLKNVRTKRNPNAVWELLSPPEVDPNTGMEIYSFRNTVTGKVIKGDTEEGMKRIMLEVVDAYDPVNNPDGMKPLMTGEDLKPVCQADYDNNRRPVMRFSLNPRGAEVFADFTRRHIDDIVAIFLGNRMLTAPRINSPITTGEGIIEGGFANLQEAQELADYLNTGALPVPLEIIAKDEIEATLGREVVQKALMAGILGLILVIVFMAAYYRLPGILADVALIIYTLFAMAAFKLLGVTMTLPGIAGFILSIGMAVDANILIFERLKEELNSGKTLRAAIDAGFNRAFPAIFDSNACTLITCAVLYSFATGMVQSFALTLAIGVIISLFTAITVTRTFLHLLVNQQWAQRPNLFGLGTTWIHRTSKQLNIVGRRNWFFALSLLIIIPGVIFYSLNMGRYGSGLKPGIEFKPGTTIQMTFDRRTSVTEIIETVASAVPNKKIETSVQLSDRGKTAFIRTNLTPGEAGYDQAIRSINSALASRIGTPRNVQTSSVGPIISKEITRKAIMAVVISAILIVIYLSFRFAVGGFINGLKYGTCTIIATLHDVFVITGLFAILGYFLGWEIDTLFVTAVLTMIGFSTHDTIVVFDRIRENLKHRIKGEDFESLANRSILQTLTRSINTSLTVILTVLALLAFGGPIIRHFYIALLVGIISGTYSSIFNATPLLVVWENISGGGKKRRSRVIEEKPMVMGKELKPVEEDESVEEGAVVDRKTAAGTKTKSTKRRKRRY